MLPISDKNELSVYQINGIENRKDKSIRRGVGLGVFDGFHIGHAELVQQLVVSCAQLGITPAIYTFHKHPSYITGDKNRISAGILTADSDKEILIHNRGVNEIFYQDFTEEFSKCSPLEFLDKYIKNIMNAELVVAGFNFRFGRDRSGDTDLLKTWGAMNGVEVIIVKPVMYGNRPISSSFIRNCIDQGDLATANAMLGRKYSLAGTVISGQKLGSKLGFPTANFYPDNGMCLPSCGVYATRLTVAQRSYEAVTNIGYRPSAPLQTDTPIIETTVLWGRDIDLYDKKVSVEFVKRMREEKIFNSLGELKEAIADDVKEASEFHKTSEDFYTVHKSETGAISILKSERFSTDILTIALRLPLDNYNASVYSLLSRVITATCKAYPSRTAFSKKLDSMYGADIDCSVDIQGDSLAINFSADALHTWRGAESPFAETLDLLFDMIVRPDFDEDGLFKKDIIDSEKAGLLTEISARENDKAQFAFDRTLELYAHDTVFAVRSFGDAEIIANLDAKDLREAYNHMMSYAQLSAGLAGKIEEDFIDMVISKIGEMLKNLKPVKKTIPGIYPGSFNHATESIKHTEVKDVEQTKICMIYKGCADYSSIDTPLFSLMNTLLGGDADSMLFRHVREEQELAYSVFSAQLKYLNAIFMEAGVAHTNVEKAINAMNSQIKKIAAGDFSDRELNSAKKTVISSLKELPDSLRGLQRFGRTSELSGLGLTPVEIIRLIENITADQIRYAASSLTHAVTYVLTGGV